MIALCPIPVRTHAAETARMSLDLITHVPPQALEHEAALLGCMLLERAAAEDAVALLKAEDLYGSKNRALFDVLRDMLEAGQPIDLVTVRAEVCKRGLDDSLGGGAWLVDLAAGVPSAASLAHYVAVVREKALRRRLIAIGSALTRDCYDPNGDPATLLDKAQADFVEAIDRSAGGAGGVVRAAAWQLVDAEIARMRAHEITPSESTGWQSLDDLLGGGMRAGELILLAARPSVGKTSFATAIARNVASRRVPVLFLSLEMPGSAIVQNLMAQAAKTNTHHVRSVRLADQEIDRIEHACEALRTYPLHVVEASAMNLFAIATEARRTKLRDGLGLVVLDYLQLVECHRQAENRNVEVGMISRGLKQLAMRLKVPVLALSQMSRDQEKGGRTRPRLSDLRDSGSLEQDADVVMFLVREGYGKAEDTSDGKTEVIVAKNRNGPIGDATFRFTKESVSFSEWRMS